MKLDGYKTADIETEIIIQKGMTQTEKIIALAELEGWKLIDDMTTGRRPGITDEHYRKYGNDRVPRYLTSHDALQPLLEKMTEEEIMAYSNTLYFKFNYVLRDALKATPEEKADLILKACGKWKE